MSSGPLGRYRVLRADAQRRLDELSSPPIQRLFAAWGDVGELLIKSEVRFRQAERCKVLGVQQGRGEDAFAGGKRYNSLLRGQLAEEVPTLIRDLRSHLASLGEVDATTLLDLGERVARDVFVNVPLSGDEARQADSLLREAFEAGRSGGAAVCDLAQEKAEELNQLRGQREEHNSIGLILLGLGILLIAVVTMIVCAATGTCGDVALIFAVSLLFLLGGEAVREGVEDERKLEHLEG